MRKHRFILGLLFLCLMAVVVASCAKGADVVTCPDGLDLCGNLCVKLSADTENCGKCGTLCPDDQACVAGACTFACPKDNIKCGGDGGARSCVNAKTDNQHCGGCNIACGAGQVCFGGVCSGTCGDAKGGQTVCGGDGGSPYCANLKNDRQNCGKCGTACADGKLCANGVCQGTCSPDQTLCGGDGGSPYCAELMSDNANCGGCGVTCGTLQSCIAGACTGLCGPGQLSCGDGGSAYCVDALSDNANCGKCGNACPSNKPICAGGTCQTISGGGTVRDVNGNIMPVTYVKCGNGTNSNCTEPVAETSCTNIGLKLVSHASDGTNAVVSLGATVSCNWSISYFTNNDSTVAGQCLMGVSNAKWSQCCGTSSWHGNIVTVPTTLGQQFGYVLSTNSGYNGGLSNVSGTTWGCLANASSVPVRGGCTTYFVACK